MKKIIIFIFILIILSCETINIIIPNDIKKSLVRSMDEKREYNPIYREFRAAWFSTVVNIDFPIKNGSETEQKHLIVKHLETLNKNNFNAVFVQVSKKPQN